jgi:hypothetical protein
MEVDHAPMARENERKYGTGTGNNGSTLLADRRSDPAHFVFELLQSADDALGKRLRSGRCPALPKAAMRQVVPSTLAKLKLFAT